MTTFAAALRREEVPQSQRLAEDVDTSRPSVAACALLVAAVVVLSVLTVLRYATQFLQADGVQQSTMSVQSVDLFFWGQNRFAAFVSLLASPVANPTWNLALCLFINALSFHLLLLVLARMGTHTLTGARSWWATAVIFLGLAATAHTILQPGRLHIMALESQPYSMSWALTLAAFMLWKRREWWAYALSAGLAWAATGLNQTTILAAAFFAIVEMARRRQWARWVLFGVIWVAWFAVWTWLSSRFGGSSGPTPEPSQPYFTFSLAQFSTAMAATSSSILSSFRGPRMVVLVVVACAALLALDAARRAALVRRFALAAVFATGYWTLFTGNGWVALSGYHFRYFYPVVLFVVVCLAAPIASLLLTWPAGWLRASNEAGRGGIAGRMARPAALLVALLACAAAIYGPLETPDRAPVLVQSRATGLYATQHDVRFVSGYYWAMWPILHQGLQAGRTALFVTGFKSGGDPAGYHDAFQSELAKGPGHPRAMCVNAPVSECLPYLTYWTAPGWVTTDETCPVPGDVPALGSPAERSCRVLVYQGDRP